MGKEQEEGMVCILRLLIGQERILSREGDMIYIGQIRICEVRPNVIFLAFTSPTLPSIAVLFAQFLPLSFHIKTLLRC
jgi:hypothetical protein